MDRVQVRNRAISEILNAVLQQEFVLRPHRRNPEVVNIFSLRRKKNVIGDLSTQSERGYFRLQRFNDGKWVSFRTMGWETDDADFVTKVLEHVGITGQF